MVRTTSKRVKTTSTVPEGSRRRRRSGSVRTVVTRSGQQRDGRGFFLGLPSEVLGLVLDKMSLVDLSVLSMVSKRTSSCVVAHISRASWRRRTMFLGSLHPPGGELGSLRERYQQLGLLFKRCTLLLPTKERLKFIFSHFSQVSCFMSDQCSLPNCLGPSISGVFLQTLVAGWDTLEIQRVFSFLSDLTNLTHRVQTVLSTKQGEKWHQELQLRRFCRKVLLEPWPQREECVWWLRGLLQPWPLVHQARLLLLLYAPSLPDGSIAWEQLVERALPPNALWELASAVLLLRCGLDVKGWTRDTLMSVLEELIVSPQPWHPENIARLLVLCGSDICYEVLASRAVSRRALGISRLIVYIALVCEKDGYPMNWVVKLVQQITRVFPSAPERFLFIQKLENMFSEVTREFFSLSFIGNHHENQENFQASCFLLDSSARFHTRFLSMLLKE